MMFFRKLVLFSAISILFACGEEKESPGPPNIANPPVKPAEPLEIFLNSLQTQAHKGVFARLDGRSLWVTQSLQPEDKVEDILVFWQEVALTAHSVLGEDLTLNMLILNIDGESLFQVTFPLARVSAYLEEEISFKAYLSTYEVSLLAQEDELPPKAVSLLTYLAGAREGRIPLVFDQDSGENEFQITGENSFVQGLEITPLLEGENGSFSAPGVDDYYVFSSIEGGVYSFGIKDSNYFYRLYDKNFKDLAGGIQSGVSEYKLNPGESCFLHVLPQDGQRGTLEYTILVEKIQQP